jgi:hypothetical protein
MNPGDLRFDDPRPTDARRASAGIPGGDPGVARPSEPESTVADKSMRRIGLDEFVEQRRGYFA